MLGGERTFIEGSRRVTELLNKAGIDSLDEPFVAFVAIASETETVPFGGLRENWHPDAKPKLEPEWAEKERWAETMGKPACIDAIAWFAKNRIA